MSNRKYRMLRVSLCDAFHSKMNWEESSEMSEMELTWNNA